MLGLRLVKKTVNQDDPTVYHLFYADERGSAGADITFFEYPGARRGRAGAGMVHRVVWRVASEEALDFWERAARAPRASRRSREPARLRFADPEGLGLELAVVETRRRAARRRVAGDPARARAAGLRRRARVRGRAGARARQLLEDALGFEPRGDGAWEVARRAPRLASTPTTRRRPSAASAGAGTVHHVAWASTMEEHEAWRERAREPAAPPTPVIDRFYFRSIYFREPSGVLFEIATIGPGFTTDEPLETLGERLSLPPDFEHLRDAGRAAC